MHRSVVRKRLLAVDDGLQQHPGDDVGAAVARQRKESGWQDHCIDEGDGSIREATHSTLAAGRRSSR